MTHEYFFYAIVAAMSIGVYYARAAVSIGTLCFGLIALLTVVQPGKPGELMKAKEVLAFMAVILVFVLSGLISSNNEMWLSRLSDNMPFLAIPAGIWAFMPFSKRKVVIAVGIFVGVTIFSSLLVMGSYALHFEEYNALYKVGKTIPTPIIHVRYAYFLALGVICAAGLLMDRSVQDVRWRRFIALAGVWLVLCVHILAVRTGIFALYGGLISLGFAYAFLRKRWRPLITVIAVITVLLAGSVLLLPSVGNKAQYMMHDLKMLRTEGISPEYSDNLRLISIMHGMAIFKEHPVIGVGIGDVEDEMEVYYNARSPMIPSDRRFPPISQYVFWLCGFGLVGTSILIGLLIYPLVQSRGESYLLIGIYALTAFSFIAETTIQLQLGKTVFVLLVSIVSAGIVSRTGNGSSG